MLANGHSIIQSTKLLNQLPAPNIKASKMAHHMSLRNNKRYYAVDHRSRKRQRRDSPSDTTTAQHAFAHNTKSHFFHLPREIRDQIYKYVLNLEDDFLFRYRGVAILGKRSHSDLWFLPRTYGLPLWLLTSQKILHEGIKTLHRAREFLGINNFLVELDTDGSALHKPPSSKPLLFNDQIRKVGFHQGRKEAWICSPYKDLGAAIYWSPTRVEELFLSHLQCVGAKDLHFYMSFSHTMELGVYDRATLKQHPKLKLFDVLPGMCKKVEIDMGLYTIDVFKYTLSKEALEETRKVVREAAGKMVEGDVSLTEVHWKKTIMSRKSKFKLPIMPSFRIERIERGELEWRMPR
jgi:hypothetical protein